MYLIFSGEGSTDVGSDEFPGPMLYLIDQLIQNNKRFSYSILDAQCYKFVSRSQLSKRARKLPTLPLDKKSFVIRGKKRILETGEFYSNARALATIALEMKAKHEHDDLLIIAVCFQDSDTTEQPKWQKKWDSIDNGFHAAHFDNGVPMLPKPVSEAWILCAIERKKNPGTNRNKLEKQEHGNRSDHALKYTLEQVIGEHPTRELLNEKIQSGEISVDDINLPSFNKFKERLEQVLELPKSISKTSKK
jgi:hypothetical protein